jgi:ribosomal protein L21E
MTKKLLIIFLMVILTGYATLGFVFWQMRMELLSQTKEVGDLLKQIDTLERQIEELEKQTKEVAIVTDKTEYEQGETVKIIIKNNTVNEKQIHYPYYTVERFDKGNWIEIKKIVCPCEVRCKIAVYFTIQPHSTKEYKWDQMEKWCSDSETISKQVPTGKYRVKSVVSDVDKYKFRETIYSNKFTIKEKEEKVAITTDKADYIQGEIVKITIENQLNKSIWHKKGTGFAFPSKVQKIENGEWKDIIRYNSCHCLTCVFQPPYLVELKPGGTITDEWDMKIFENHRPLCPPAVPIASPGKYRVYFSYFLKPEAEQDGIRVYSNEFTIQGSGSEEGWITGGSRTSAILVKPSKKILKPGEEFSIFVKSWTFNPSGGIKEHNTYLRLYNTTDPEKPIYSKESLIRQKEGDWYARIEPFEWTIQAPQQPGDYTYRIVEKPNSWPSFNDYGKKVEFKIRVSKSGE